MCFRAGDNKYLLGPEITEISCSSTGISGWYYTYIPLFEPSLMHYLVFLRILKFKGPKNNFGLWANNYQARPWPPGPVSTPEPGNPKPHHLAATIDTLLLPLILRFQFTTTYYIPESHLPSLIFFLCNNSSLYLQLFIYESSFIFIRNSCIFLKYSIFPIFYVKSLFWELLMINFTKKIKISIPKINVKYWFLFSKTNIKIIRYSFCS